METFTVFITHHSSQLSVSITKTGRCTRRFKIRKINLIFFLLLTGCATPAQQFAARAAEYGFAESTMQGQNFQHRIYANQLSLLSKQHEVLHVYLDGDGTPWQHHAPSEDPTSRNPLILSLMAQDPNPSLLLGRPCYHGFYTAPNCHKTWWTDKRYAVEIVESMAAALNHWLQKQRFSKAVLIGYSGGGTLAVLMAEKVPAVQTIVTLAANLDVAAWNQTHDYQTLSQSLNPITQKKLPTSIRQLHLAGGADENVSSEIIKAYASRQPSDFYIFPDFDHECCWENAWPEILKLF